MIEPKTFYRKLDFLQSRIDSGKTAKDFLFTIVKELEKTLGKDLNFINGCIYEKDDSGYFLISAPTHIEKTLKPKLHHNDHAVMLLKKSMTYIYDKPVFHIDRIDGEEGEYKTNAAFTVNSPNHSWIFVFELMSGWIREEIDLCLNAIRTALNYRLVAESIQNEMEQANQIQLSLLPMIPPEIQGYQIAARSVPAELVGGDLYDYYSFDENTFGFCIGDASGHGLPAALMVRDVITGLRMGLEKEMKIVYTLKKLNSVIYHAVYSAKFISLFYAEIEKNGNIIYANAGHPSPLLFDGENFSLLDSTGLIIGAFPDIDISRSYTKLPPGGILVLFTDGIVERKNKHSEQFEIDRLKSIICENKEKSAEFIMNSIFEASEHFGKGDKWEDDATVVVIKRE